MIDALKRIRVCIAEFWLSQKVVSPRLDIVPEIDPGQLPQMRPTQPHYCEAIFDCRLNQGLASPEPIADQPQHFTLNGCDPSELCYRQLRYSNVSWAREAPNMNYADGDDVL